MRKVKFLLEFDSATVQEQIGMDIRVVTEVFLVELIWWEALKHL